MSELLGQNQPCLEAGGLVLCGGRVGPKAIF